MNIRCTMPRRMWLLGICLLLWGGMAYLAHAEEKPHVSLTIDYGDGVQKRFPALAWKEGYTIADALDAAQRHPRGIQFKHRGKGETALLQAIDDVKNGTDDKYWLFEVNGVEGDRSFALVKLKPGDSVLWTFKGYP